MKFYIFTFFLFISGSAYCDIPDTGQDRCYSLSREIPCPKAGYEYYGQDAQYQGPAPSYVDNGDGTVTDMVTKLTWTKAVGSRKLSLDEAQKEAEKLTVGGFTDWRVPNIKELYSLIDFRGYTGFSKPERPMDGKPGRREMGSGMSGPPERQGRGMYSAEPPSNAVPFIDTDYFGFRYGGSGERYIDAQWLSSTKYVSRTMGGMETLFGVNFADGRIKGYGYSGHGRKGAKKFYVRYVRGGGYGYNVFHDNGDGTVTDRAVGLMWTKADSSKGMTWKEALEYAEESMLAGYSDWRLPNAKELQYIVDYSRSPDTTASPAIDPVFELTHIKNEAGQADYPFYWTSTTHLDGPKKYISAVYIAFGRAIGQMRGQVMDVHGAGAQRSDPKEGKPELGHGPQGDAVRVYNYVLCVRDAD